MPDIMTPQEQAQEIFTSVQAIVATATSHQKFMEGLHGITLGGCRSDQLKCVIELLTLAIEHGDQDPSYDGEDMKIKLACVQLLRIVFWHDLGLLSMSPEQNPFQAVDNVLAAIQDCALRPDKNMIPSAKRCHIMSMLLSQRYMSRMQRGLSDCLLNSKEIGPADEPRITTATYVNGVWLPEIGGGVVPLRNILPFDLYYSRRKPPSLLDCAFDPAIKAVKSLSRKRRRSCDETSQSDDSGCPLAELLKDVTLEDVASVPVDQELKKSVTTSENNEELAMLPLTPIVTSDILARRQMINISYLLEMFQQYFIKLLREEERQSPEEHVEPAAADAPIAAVPPQLLEEVQVEQGALQQAPSH